MDIVLYFDKNYLFITVMAVNKHCILVLKDKYRCLLKSNKNYKNVIKAFEWFPFVTLYEEVNQVMKSGVS